MDFVPHTAKETKEMFDVLGISDFSELFKDIPSEIPRANLSLPAGISEQELIREIEKTASLNISTNEYASYLGAGSYEHFIPSVVPYLAGRGEFVTAYTPYQAEASQGILQAMYEYQSLICMLTGLDVSNASLYDGATAVCEAVLLSIRSKEIQNGNVIVSKTVHPEYREVLKTYLKALPVEIIEAPYINGITDYEFIKSKTNEKTFAIVIQSPNFFGCIEQAWEIPLIAQKHGALSIMTANPISLGVLKCPGEMGFDIAAGEGQPLGMPMSYGGPYLGYFACKKELVRKMPGRIAGMTKDADGKRGFVLTLQTREQHIRREKATSNICSNEALCALTACIYLSVLGKNGIKKIGELNIQLSHYAKDKLCAVNGVKTLFNQPFFNEFVIETPVSENKFLENKIIPGLNLGKFYPELNYTSLWCVTEMKTKEQIDRLAEVIGCK